MEKFTSLTSSVMPLPRKDIDTDLIIPAQYLTSISRYGYGKNLFRHLRDSDPEFPLNKERYGGAQILITGSNFGCGSSREHAVWALMQAGFRAVIAPSFADIFSANSTKNGLLLVTLPEKKVMELIAEAEKGARSLTIDLKSQTVTRSNGEVLPFEYDGFRKHCLLNGLDDIDYILSHEHKIEAYRNKQTKEEHFAAAANAPDEKW